MYNNCIETSCLPHHIVQLMQKKLTIMSRQRLTSTVTTSPRAFPKKYRPITSPVENSNQALTFLSTKELIKNTNGRSPITTHHINPTPRLKNVLPCPHIHKSKTTPSNGYTVLLTKECFFYFSS